MSDRDQRTDSTAEQLRAMENAHRIHDWPDEAGACTDATWNVFSRNQAHRSYDDWFPADLFELARLSRMQVDAVDLQERLDDEGYIVLGGKSGNTPVENPVGRALSTLNSNITQIMRRLGMTASGQGDKRTKTNKAEAERKAAAATQAGQVTDDEFDRSRLM